MAVARTPLEIVLFEIGMTRKELARVSGLNRSLTSQIVCGRVNPNAYEKKVIADALGKRVSTLFPVREALSA